MNSLVSGISDDALVTSYDISEKWSLNVPFSPSPLSLKSQEWRTVAAASTAMIVRIFNFSGIASRVLFGTKLLQKTPEKFKIHINSYHLR